MTDKKTDAPIPRPTLDQIADAIREAPIDPEQRARAADRVRAALTQAAPAAGPAAGADDAANLDCAGFQRLIPAYREGTLARPRVLLLEDHTLECLDCRRALRAQTAAPATRTAPVSAARWRWPVGLAAALLLAVAGWVAVVLQQDQLLEDGAAARVQAFDGRLLFEAPAGFQPLQLGMLIPTGRVLKTAKESRATLELSDHSVIELNERSELVLTRQERGTTIHLVRGDIIVEAAPQPTGLYVRTDECEVMVTGTIFSVSHGTKGSRVSVIEGDVQVHQSGTVVTLTPGQQAATRERLAGTPVEEEIAWSAKVDTYLTLLEELSTVRETLAAAALPRASRPPTTVPAILPPGTVVYTFMPNLSQDFQQARQLLEERVTANPLLADWWVQLTEAQRTGPAGAFMPEELLDRLEGFGDLLGEEVTFLLVADPATRALAPAVVAEVASEAAALDELRRLEALVAQGPDQGFQFLTGDPAGFAAAEGRPLIMVRGGYFAAAPTLPVMRQLAASIDRHRAGQPNPFADTSFHRKILARVQADTEWLVCVDMERLVSTALQEEADAAGLAEARRSAMLELYRRMGLLDLESFVFRRGGTDSGSAALNFKDTRSGIASWLAPPAPMGSLDFISPEALFALGVVFKDPAALVEDVLALAEVEETDCRAGIEAFETEHGIDLLADLAAPIGGELAIAVDGPILPAPSWKIVLEVYDPVRLQQTLEQMITLVNQDRDPGLPTAVLEAVPAGGWTLYRLTQVAAEELWYAYRGGYLVATPNQPLLRQALQGYDTGQGLTDAPGFQALLPQDTQMNFSLLLYQDFASLFAPFVENVLGGAERLNPDQRARLQELAPESTASMLYAYGEPERILFQTSGLRSGFGTGFGSLASLSFTAVLQELVALHQREALQPEG